MVDKTSVEVARTLNHFIANVGIPQDLISDNALELTDGKVIKFVTNIISTVRRLRHAVHGGILLRHREG
jgi:hypothetical protein